MSVYTVKVHYEVNARSWEAACAVSDTVMAEHPGAGVWVEKDGLAISFAVPVRRKAVGVA